MVEFFTRPQSSAPLFVCFFVFAVKRNSRLFYEAGGYDTAIDLCFKHSKDHTVMWPVWGAIRSAVDNDPGLGKNFVRAGGYDAARETVEALFADAGVMNLVWWVISTINQGECFNFLF